MNKNPFGYRWKTILHEKIYNKGKERKCSLVFLCLVSSTESNREKKKWKWKGAEMWHSFLQERKGFPPLGELFSTFWKTIYHSLPTKQRKTGNPLFLEHIFHSTKRSLSSDFLGNYPNLHVPPLLPEQQSKNKGWHKGKHEACQIVWRASPVR